MVSLPAWVPGANNSAFKFSTTTTSTPAWFLAPKWIPLSSPTTTRGPFTFLYFLPLVLPLPALILFPSLARTTSS